MPGEKQRIGFCGYRVNRRQSLSELNTEPGWCQDINRLLGQSRVCYLATQGKNGPESSMAPFALFRGTLLLHLSALAAHHGNISRQPLAGAMICTPETAEMSVLALPRLALQGRVSAVPAEALTAAKAAYLKAIPDAEPLFSFADFRLFSFAVTQANWVGGFGKARSITQAQWNQWMGASVDDC